MFMLVKEILSRRDTLRNYLSALKRSIVQCELYMHDEEMIQHLQSLKAEVEKEYDEINKALKPFEDLEM